MNFYFDKTNYGFSEKNYNLENYIEVKIDKNNPPGYCVKNEDGTFKGFYPKYQLKYEKDTIIKKTDAEILEYENNMKKEQCKTKIIELQLKIDAGEKNKLDMTNEQNKLKDLNKEYKKLG